MSLEKFLLYDDFVDDFQNWKDILFGRGALGTTYSPQYIILQEISGTKDNDNTYFITGPNAFPQIPAELSQVIDILKLSVRKVDMDIIAMKLLQNFEKRMHDLEMGISSTRNGSKGIKTLESHYSDLLNLYYDYDSWLPGRFTAVADHLMELSKKIEHLK